MYETILVAVDDSDPARAALEHAVALADAVGADLHVLSVVDTSGRPTAFGVAEVDDLNRTVSTLTEDVLAAHGGRDLAVDAEVRRGRPHEIVLEYAAEIDADLTVLGQQGETGLPAAILGSTTDRVARLSPIPVTVVPGPDEA